MSEGAHESLPEEQRNARNTARQTAIEACEAWLGQWEHDDPELLTGFVVAMEVTRVGSHSYTTWMTGNGADISDMGLGGLPTHRIRGLLHEILAELDAREVEVTRRRMEADGE